MCTAVIRCEYYTAVQHWVLL